VTHHCTRRARLQTSSITKNTLYCSEYFTGLANMDSSYAFGWPGFGDSDSQTDFGFNFAQSAAQPAVFPGASSVAPHMLQAYPSQTHTSLASFSTTVTPGPSRDALSFAPSSATAVTQPMTNGTAACAGCRMRRVKCVRPTSNEEDACAACQKKGIRCLPAAPKPKGKRKYGDRAGDRIEAARAQCGSIREGSPRSSLSPGSVASRLDDLQTQATFCAALVDDYYRCAYIIQPCVNVRAFLCSGSTCIDARIVCRASISICGCRLQKQLP